MTTRSIFVGILATIALAIATPISDLWIQGTWLAACHLPIGVLVILVLLQLALNPLLHRIGAPFTHAELVTIYAMTLVSAGIPSLGFAAYLIPVLAAPAYYQTPENELGTTFFHYIPDWLAPMDAKASRLFYEGTQVQRGNSVFAFHIPAIPWAVWMKPLMAWSLFALGLFLAMTCTCALLRRQWIERERLFFPLVQLPIEMLGAETHNTVIPAFFRSRMVWLGIALPALVHGWNGLHFHFPIVPEFSLFHDLGRYFTEKPWNIVRPLWAIIHFSAIGFVFLLPTDLAFSLWFFYFLFHAEAIVITQLGLPLGQ
ncbi:hypothetical protein HYR99_40410, partial [Candidatus Poribacteria bacterium]|nr:hypothetical protein [Candidatus Poribacteria bacterium]